MIPRERLFIFVFFSKLLIQLALSMDRSIRLTMKDVASYVIYYELRTL